MDYTKFIKKLSLDIVILASVFTMIFSNFYTKTFANSLSLSEIFKDILSEQNKSIPDGLGKIIDKSVSSNNLDISLKGILGDEDTIYLMLEAIDKSGNILKRDKKSQLSFGNVYLNTNINNPSDIQYCNADINSIENNKATFLIKQKVQSENIIGNKATLTLQNLMEYKAPNAKEIGMTYNNLYDIYTQFKETPVFITEDMEEELDSLIAIDENGQREPIVKSGNEKISFSNKFKDLYISNIAFKDNTLYMNFFLDSNEDINKYLSLAFKNIKTGEIVEFYNSSSSANLDNGVTTNSEMKISCKDITSAEQLKDYIIVTDADYRFEPVVEGEWKFEFDLDYKNTTQTYKVNQQLDLINSSFYCEKVKISPISMNMKLKTDIQDMPLIDNIKLVMNDGSIIDNVMDIQCVYDYDEKTKIGTLKCILPYLINISDIKNIQIENHIINLK